MDETSKSAKKREAFALQELGKRLLELSPEQLNTVGIAREIREAIHLYRTLKTHGARRRQMQYIGVLMRNTDPEPIRQMINEMDKGQKNKVREFQQIEILRDSLIEKEDTVFEDIVSRFPEADILRLRQIVRNARKEKKEDLPPKHSRALFRYLRELSIKS
jgi:ribosome-associated protein